LNRKSIAALMLMGFFMLACSKPSKEQVAEVIKENPEVLFEAMKGNPVAFMETLQQVSQMARAEMEKKRVEEEDKLREKYLDEPLSPRIRGDELIQGSREGDITLIVYSDFECPYCERGYRTTKRLLEAYKGRIRFIYKHLPLQNHPMGQSAAGYYEALRLQNPQWAIRFHDALYEGQGKLREGESYLEALAKELGANMKRLKSDLESEGVKKRIAEDMAEAASFGIQGTPGFLLNGVPIKGAYPYEYFIEILGKLKEKGKLK
jgi:protein-disulfide isomerase